MRNNNTEIKREYKFAKSILSSLFRNEHPVLKTLERFAKFKGDEVVFLDKRLQGLLHRCGNINAMKEFLVYLVFETYLLQEKDYSYQLARLGEFESLNDSSVFSALTEYEQHKLMKLMQWQFNRVKRMCDYICNNINTPSNKHVLDIGCGIGQLSYILAKQGMKVTGIDLNIDQALTIQAVFAEKHSYARNVVFEKGDALDLSEIKSSFDIITLADVVEHITEKEQLFSEINKKLNSNGIIAIHTDNLTKLKLLQIVKRIIYLLTFRNPRNYNMAWSGGEGGHVGLQTPESITDYLEKLNFKAVFEYDKDGALSNIIPNLFVNGFMLIAKKKLTNK